MLSNHNFNFEIPIIFSYSSTFNYTMAFGREEEGVFDGEIWDRVRWGLHSLLPLMSCKSNQIFIVVFMGRDIDVQKCPMEESEKKDQERKCLRSTESINI